MSSFLYGLGSRREVTKTEREPGRHKLKSPLAKSIAVPEPKHIVLQRDFSLYPQQKAVLPTGWATRLLHTSSLPLMTAPSRFLLDPASPSRSLSRLQVVLFHRPTNNLPSDRCHRLVASLYSSQILQEEHRRPPKKSIHTGDLYVFSRRTSRHLADLTLQTGNKNEPLCNTSLLIVLMAPQATPQEGEPDVPSQVLHVEIWSKTRRKTMLVRLLRSGQRTQAFLSRGTVQCALCQTFIRPNGFYTRHQTEISATSEVASPRQSIYNLCYQHAPFRKETEEVQRLNREGITLPPALKKTTNTLKTLLPPRNVPSGCVISIGERLRRVREELTPGLRLLTKIAINSKVHRNREDAFQAKLGSPAALEDAADSMEQAASSPETAGQTTLEQAGDLFGLTPFDEGHPSQPSGEPMADCEIASPDEEVSAPLDLPPVESDPRDCEPSPVRAPSPTALPPLEPLPVESDPLDVTLPRLKSVSKAEIY